MFPIRGFLVMGFLMVSLYLVGGPAGIVLGMMLGLGVHALRPEWW